MITHTKGQWSTDGEFVVATTQDGGTTTRIAECINACYLTKNANARLMASAPDLLKALERLMSSFCNVAPSNPEEYGAYVNAVEVVKSAKGGQV